MGQLGIGQTGIAQDTTGPPCARSEPDTIDRWATFDPTGHYRYRLGRCWQPTAPALALVMLNPSRADAHREDPTLRRCLQFARRWGFGRLVVVNLFAYCSPHPAVLGQVSDPIGPDNDRWLSQTAAEATTLMLAWGNQGSLLHRDRHVLALLAPHHTRCYCLGRNRTGQPRHPLYAPRTSTLQPFLWPD